MIWLILFSIIAICVLLFPYALFIRNKEGGWLDFIVLKEYRLPTLKLVLLSIIVVLVICWRNVYEMADCTIYANSLKTSGTWSWWYQECNLEPNANGLIPKKRIIGSPNSNSHVVGDQ